MALRLGDNDRHDDNSAASHQFQEADGRFSFEKAHEGRIVRRGLDYMVILAHLPQSK
jgi:hypothetical protein